MKLLITTQAVDKNDSNLGFFHRWIEEFAKDCEKVTVICLREGEHHLPKNVEVLSLGKEKGTSRLTRLVRFYRFIITRRHSYDAVFVHMNPEYVVLGGWLWRMWHKKIVLWYTHKSVDLKLRIAVLFANRVATASKESFRLRSRKVTVVGHGIDTPLFHPELRHKEGDVMRLVTVGRIAESKHLFEMLAVLDVLYARDRVFTFEIIGGPITHGDTEYVKTLRKAIKERPFAKDITFRGGVPYHELPGILMHKDVFINLSTTGSVDKAVLDALAAGVPAVTSNEAFKNHSIVRYCALNPELLARAVEELYDSPPSPQVLSLEVAKHYGLAQCISRVLALYAK